MTKKAIKNKKAVSNLVAVIILLVALSIGTMIILFMMNPS